MVRDRGVPSSGKDRSISFRTKTGAYFIETNNIILFDTFYQEMHPMQNPYHSSTTALFDSTERLNKAADQYDYYNGSLHKVPLDVSQDWDGYMMKGHSNRDSGLVRAVSISPRRC